MGGERIYDGLDPLYPGWVMGLGRRHDGVKPGG